jgi:pimeloyl-ACP methyl ester carboxylesterase
LKFLREHARPGTFAIETEETTYEREGVDLEATVYRPPGFRHGAAWVVLHGLTVPGRRHESLVRFARALAATDALVFAPDIPEWRDLRLATDVSVPSIRAAVHALAGRPDADAGRIGLVGFSFGATQSLVAASDPGIGAILNGIAAWGGYRDVRRLFRFGISGRHDIDGREYRINPDPYGGWLVGANYLPKSSGYEEHADVAHALRTLALEAGRRRVYAWDPGYEPLKRELRVKLPARSRPLFDIFAPPSGEPIRDVPSALSVADALAAAALRTEPMLDPGPALPRLTTPVLIAHGRDDRLVPFTESLRLGRDLPPGILTTTGITSLFAHSGGTQAGIGWIGTVREGVRFAALLNRIATMI